MEKTLYLVVLLSVLFCTALFGQLTVVNASLPRTEIVAAETVDIPVMPINFSAANNSNYKITSFQIYLTSSYRSIESVKAIANGNLIGLSAPDVNGKIKFSNLNLIVPANQASEVRFYVTVKNVGTSGAFSGDLTVFHFSKSQGFVAEDQNGNAVQLDGEDLMGDGLVVHKSFPVITKMDIGSSIVPGQSNLIYKFKVTAVGSTGTRVRIKMLPLSILLQGRQGSTKARLSNFRIQEDGVTLNSANCGTDAYRVYLQSNNGSPLDADGYIESGHNEQKVFLSFNDARTVIAGSSKTYSVYATLSATEYSLTTYMSDAAFHNDQGMNLLKTSYGIYSLTNANHTDNWYVDHLWSDASGTNGDGINTDVNACENYAYGSSADWFDGFWLKSLGSSYSQMFQSQNFIIPTYVDVQNITITNYLPPNQNNISVLGFSMRPTGDNVEVKKWRVELHSLGVDLDSADARVMNGSFQSYIQNIKIIASDNSFSTDSKDIGSFRKIPGGGLFAEYYDSEVIGNGVEKSFNVVLDTKNGLAPGQYYVTLGSTSDGYCFSSTAIKELSTNQYVLDIAPNNAVVSGVLNHDLVRPDPVTLFKASPGNSPGNIKLEWQWSRSATWFEIRCSTSPMDTNNMYSYQQLSSPPFVQGQNSISTNYQMPSSGLYYFAIQVVDSFAQHSVWKFTSGNTATDFDVSVYQGGEDLIDTFYVLPGEWFFNQFGLKSQSLPMFAIEAHINVDGIVYFNNGHFDHQESDSLNYWKLTGGLASWNLLWMPNFSSAVGQTKWLCSIDAVMRLPIDSVAKIEVNGCAANVVGSYGYYNKKKCLKGRNGKRGDINQDGVVNQVDVEALVDYNDGHHYVAGNWDIKYTLNGINMGLGAGFFPYPEFAFTAMINLYVHNPNDPIVQGLGIGELFTVARQVFSTAVTYQQNGNALNIQTEGNIVSVVGELNGQMWQKTYLSTNNVVIPQGLKIISVDASRVPNRVVTAVNEQINKVKSFELNQNYPNPFNPSTTIKYTIPITGHVSLKVFDILGKEITTLVSSEKSAGTYEVVFNASNLASGVYVYRLQAGNAVQAKKMLLIK